MTQYRAIISSDWNGCLAPCGPFDGIAHSFPQQTSQLDALFKAYTSNRISLVKACDTIRTLLPGPITVSQMDAYLDRAFTTYTGVCELIDWCRQNSILFMINTTGPTGYFQRALAKGYLPPIAALSSNDLTRFPAAPSDPTLMLALDEIQDKGGNSARVLQSMGHTIQACIIIGDSGGDGPHFEWGAQTGALLIGSMPKPSLLAYCSEKAIAIDLLVGRDAEDFDFMGLTPVIEDFLNQKLASIS